MRAQLEQLLEVGQLRNVEIQVIPTGREEYPVLGGSIMLIDPHHGAKVGHIEAQTFSRVIPERKRYAAWRRSMAASGHRP
ncbi:hypothetical protein KY5_6037c [Streptomyces formicae]|uniref:DUF5753 domain-containing protein n=1 Tax=Streptomyces formicae TaxID=1616117 RepID=A0A291QHY6_9ACTN|nr:hypothetical protein KY5_6037c [Streptomyces formicae]